MAKGVNKVILLGTTGQDPEIRATQSGTVIANIRLATSEKYKDQSGNFVDKTEWHNVVAFGKLAEIIREYVKKGKQLYIEGSLRTSSWDDKQSGQKRYKTEVVAADIALLGGGGGEREGGQSYGGSQNYGGGQSYGNAGGYSQRGGTASFDSRSNAQDGFANEGITDDDIPF